MTTDHLPHHTPSHHAPGTPHDASPNSPAELHQPGEAGDASVTPAVAFLDEAPTPAGPVHFATDIHGAVLALQFIEGSYPRTFLDELVRDGYATTMRDDAKTGTVRRAIEAWTQGEFGETWTYGQLARALGRPTAVRAVARANATNRVPLIVPCHRVIGTDGTLTGFGGGLHLKARLLNHELRVMGLPQPWKA
ncbi:MAG: methylated-DNA--[protein]-cysteine S-methyltransferase [Chloroflexi bacterium]|nr:methylated-DNA--[protein]-cysteine S-methyltransferase [Chloroflexota bacterium]